MRFIGMLFLALLSFLLADYVWNCYVVKVNKEEAIHIAEKYAESLSDSLDIKNPLVLRSKKNSENQNLWNFRFTSEACTVDIIIDDCGSSDIGGITHGCHWKK